MAENEQMVRVLMGRKSDVYENVPISRVPPGYVPIHIRDRGNFYINPTALSPARVYQHPPFAPDVCAELQKQHAALVRAGWEQTLDEWLDGFRCDMTPWREMAYWDFFLAAAGKFTVHLPGDDEMSVSKRRDVLELVTTVSNDLARAETQLRSGRAFGPVGSLTAKRVTEIVRWLLSDDAVAIRRRALAKYQELLRGRIAKVLPDRVSLHALVDEEGRPNLDAAFDPVEVIATADIVLGEDVADPSKRLAAYGKERLARLAANTVDGRVNVAGVRIVWVEIDIDTDEYDRLIKLVTDIKGADDPPLLPTGESPA
jgi:hypothetical protein